MVNRAICEYLSGMMNLLLLILFCRGGDETVLATAERLYHNGDLETAAEIISSHVWSSDSLWSRAGLFLQLCTEGLSLTLEPIQGETVYNFHGDVRVEVECSFSCGDSLRLYIPVPSELPWQIHSERAEISVRGIQQYSVLSSGWLLLEGVSQGQISAVFSVPVTASCDLFAGSGAAEDSDAMVFYPGEDPFMDSCLDEHVFWAGGDIVYLESVSLARAEPNPIMLIERVRDRIAGFSLGTDPVDQRILLTPASELCLTGEMDNSAGGVLLAAAILRRLQIPALAVPGRFNLGRSSGYVLFVHVKPFGWMILSPVPGDFIAFGTPEPPPVRSWSWGVPGLTVYAESQNSDFLWSALSPDSIGLTYTLDISPL